MRPVGSSSSAGRWSVATQGRSASKAPGASAGALAQHLVRQHETVYEVNPRWTASTRRRARRTDKSDHLDSRAVALFVRQEAPDLPAVSEDDETVALDVLSHERDAAQTEATRLRNQIHALLSTRPALPHGGPRHEDAGRPGTPENVPSGGGREFGAGGTSGGRASPCAQARTGAHASRRAGQGDSWPRRSEL